MKVLQLLFVCWFSRILTVTSCIRVDGFSCVSDYWKTIACVLNITSNPVEQNTTYSLIFTSKEKSSKISLVTSLVLNRSYSYDCKVNNTRNFSSFNNYSLKLCNKSDCHVLNDGFIPSQNIQLTPPHDTEVQQTPKAVNITWKSGYEAHRYLCNALDYELLFQKPQSSESRIFQVDETFMSIPRLRLDKYATFCFKVRSKPKSVTGYVGTWSTWSAPSCWKNEEEQENILVILTKFLVPLCGFVGVLLIVLYSPAARMKIKTLSHAPSPASFFQPLFQQHHGNLQEWLSPEGKFALTYKTEEILITDAVTVGPKLVKKEPEEINVFQNPSVTQVAFTQCQTSYVGLPEMHEASQPTTMVCPAATSYTQLPCSVWGFGVAEVQVVCSSPQDFLEISRTDSGCSCEDLTQSPECSLPNSPVDDISPPCYNSDYCILNKTAEGVVPVLVSR